MKLKSDYPIKMLCDLLALPRSSWYYRPVERDERDDFGILRWVHPSFGARCA
jgi:hypothetical protein